LKNNIAVILQVYNEESRLRSCLNSFYWADELLLIDKSSTDKTVEIAKEFTKNIVIVPFSEGSKGTENNINRFNIDSEWIFFITASSMIHPDIVDDIIMLTTDNNFNYDIVGIPYAMYSFGIRSKRSPWTDERKYTLLRKSKLISSDKLHHENQSSSSRRYHMKIIDSERVLYHCTNDNADNYFKRQMMYTSYESHYEKTTLNKIFLEILKSIGIVVLKRRFFLGGKDALALSMAYISYHMMKFVYYWDRNNKNNGDNVYPKIRGKIDKLWQEKK
jgi:(heptosyl)LPS beta-1,4-glucosyltransferase